MIRTLQQFPVWQRRLIFFLTVVGGLMLLLAVTLLLVNQTLNGQRMVSVALIPEVTVRQFAALPDDNAYPSSVAVAPDGTVYTGSFGSGAIWSITPEGEVSEIPGTRESIGAVMALTVAPDGSLLVVDQEDTDPRTSGGKLIRVQDDTVTTFVDIGFIAPNDIAIDAAGHIYVSDAGGNGVWRIDADGLNGAIWWEAPAQPEGSAIHPAVTGLAYDALDDALIVTDPEVNDVYRVSISDGATETIYHHGDRANPPGFNGVTVTPDGTIYVAVLGQNGVAQINDGRLDYIAGLFRGSSDVAYAAPNRLYVANFDQTSIVLPVVRPQIPFAIDVIELQAP
jgi:DNA-binding beta-propeller fold protein YncE